jgi:hypothetical protein
MECTTPEMGGEGSLATFEMELLMLIMYLVVSCEQIHSRTAPVRNGCPDKFSDLIEAIHRQLVQLNPNVAQNICNTGWGGTQIRAVKKS